MRNLILIGALGLLMQTASRAGLSIEAEASAPETEFLLRCDPGGSSDLRWYYLTSNPIARRDVGQIIEPTAPMAVQRLVLQLADHDKTIGDRALGAPVTLRWYEFEDLETLDQQKPMAEQTGHLPTDIQPGQHLIFSFPSVALESGRRYAVIVSFDDADTNRFLNFAVAPLRNYPEGRIIFFTTSEIDPALHYDEFSANLVFGLMDH